MKTLQITIAFIVLFGAALASAEENRNVLYGQDVYNCSSWTMIHGSNNSFGGYGCMSYPSRVSVPDLYSTNNTIQDLYNKIRDLEARIAKLEQQQAGN